MKTYKLSIQIRLKPEVLDPQGQAIKKNLSKLDYVSEDVRVGKQIDMVFASEPSKEQIENMCETVLSNPVIEDYSYTIIVD